MTAPYRAKVVSENEITLRNTLNTKVLDNGLQIVLKRFVAACTLLKFQPATVTEQQPQVIERKKWDSKTLVAQFHHYVSDH